MLKMDTYHNSHFLLGSSYEGCFLGNNVKYIYSNLSKLNHLLTKAYCLEQGVFIFEILDPDLDLKDLNNILHRTNADNVGYAKYLDINTRILICFFTDKGEDLVLGYIDSITTKYKLLDSFPSLFDCNLVEVSNKVYQFAKHQDGKFTKHSKLMTASNFDKNFCGKKLTVIPTGMVVEQLKS